MSRAQVIRFAVLGPLTRMTCCLSDNDIVIEAGEAEGEFLCGDSLRRVFHVIGAH